MTRNSFNRSSGSIVFYAFIVLVGFLAVLFIFQPVGLTVDSLLYYFSGNPLQTFFTPEVLIATFILLVAGFVLWSVDSPNIRGR